MPTPVAAIIDGAQTITDAYVAAGAFFTMISLFVAFMYGKRIVGWLVGLASRLARK